MFTNWFKSSYTHHEENACVEVGHGGGRVGIRDTKQWAMAARPQLVVPRAAFAALVAEVAGNGD